MTISSDTARWALNGNGSNDTFAYTTKIFATSDLSVYVDNTLKTLTTHYTVTGAGNDNGGNVVFTAGNIPGVGTGNVVIVKNVPYTQTSALPLGGDFPSTTVEDMVDKSTIHAQQVKSIVTRSVRQPDSDAADIAALPIKATRASKYLAFDTNGDPLATAGTTDVTIHTSFMVTLHAATTAAAAATILGLGTGDSPQLTGINLGHASDTTLARSAAGRLAVEGKNALLDGTTDELSAGYSAAAFSAGTKSSGTFTPDEANGNFQYAVNGGAHTLAPPTNNCSILLLYTNNASAGAVTTSGFTKVTGDSLTTTNGHVFMLFVTKTTDGSTAKSHLFIQAMQ